jgi:hypothetical protein
MHRAILIKSCQRYRARREACMQTWAGKLLEDVPVYFVEGGHDKQRVAGNVIELSCGDDYRDNSYKVRDAIHLLLAETEFDSLFIVDDDAFVHPGRWMAYLPESEFVGLATEDIPWPHGGCGWFASRQCCDLYANNVHRRGSDDDVMFWEILTRKFGVVMTNRPDLFSWRKDGERPAPNNSIIACHYVDSEEMNRLYSSVKSGDLL